MPDALKPIAAHGAKLRQGEGGQNGNWIGDCPFCGKRDHFFASPKTGMWDCKVCGKNGNPITYLTAMAKKYEEAMTPMKRTKLFRLRGIPVQVFKKSKIGWIESEKAFAVPCFSETGTVRDIRRWTPKGGMKSTMGCKSQLWGADALKKARPGARVWLCEGEWDGMAMRWLLDAAGFLDDVVVAVPGANTLKKEWPQDFAGKSVVALYDNDEAGDEGASKAHAEIRNFAMSMKFVHWPDGRPNGFDLRDFAIEKMAGGGSAEAVIDELLSICFDEPRVVQANVRREEWHPPEGMEPLREMDVDEVIDTFRKQIYMTAEMETMLKLMLATALSNDIVSDPVWLYLVGPPGSGKTLLLSAFQGTERCVFRSSLTPASLVSGWKADNGNDPSLIPKLNGKTLVAKDFTEILDMPTLAQDEIFSTLRGAFDGHVQRSFGNGVSREYRGCFFSILAGVTHAIHGHKKAHLGERFLRFEMRPMPERHMDAVLKAAIDSIGDERGVELKLQHAVACFLQKRVDPRQAPKMTAETKRRLQHLVKLIALMRAQVSKDPRTGEVTYRPRAELGTRLAKQLAKLGSMYAFVEGKEEVDAEVYDVISRVAFDTVGGYSLEVLEAMMKMGGNATRADVAEKIKASVPTVYRRFEDLATVGIIAKNESLSTPSSGGGRPPAVYEVTREVAQLWNESRRGEESWQKSSRERSSSRSSRESSEARSAKGSTRSSASSASSRPPRPRSSETSRPPRPRSKKTP